MNTSTVYILFLYLLPSTPFKVFTNLRKRLELNGRKQLYTPQPEQSPKDKPRVCWHLNGCRSDSLSAVRTAPHKYPLIATSANRIYTSGVLFLKFSVFPIGHGSSHSVKASSPVVSSAHRAIRFFGKPPVATSRAGGQWLSGTPCSPNNPALLPFPLEKDPPSTSRKPYGYPLFVRAVNIPTPPPTAGRSSRRYG